MAISQRHPDIHVWYMQCHICKAKTLYATLEYHGTWVLISNLIIILLQFHYTSMLYEFITMFLSIGIRTSGSTDGEKPSRFFC